MAQIIYVLTNETMPALVEIGMTTDSVESRLSRLSPHSGVPLPSRCAPTGREVPRQRPCSGRWWCPRAEAPFAVARKRLQGTDGDDENGRDAARWYPASVGRRTGAPPSPCCSDLGANGANWVNWANYCFGASHPPPNALISATLASSRAWRTRTNESSASCTLRCASSTSRKPE